MSLEDESGDRVAITRMNSELRHAQLELLSAQCATDRVRLRYSAANVARHAQRDVLRKARASASALYEYYNGLCEQLAEHDGGAKADELSLSEARVLEARDRLAQYLREQRENFRLIAEPLASAHRQTMEPFFSPLLLGRVRIVTLDQRRAQNPPFYADAKALGLDNLPEIPHMASLTFVDVVVFHEAITNRSLFHALVHAVQFEVLGLEGYAERFVRGFLRTRSHVTVPLEAHTFMLESAFAGSQERVFSVEEKVRLWTNQRRY